jgi:hypothetical protein
VSSHCALLFTIICVSVFLGLKTLDLLERFELENTRIYLMGHKVSTVKVILAFLRIVYAPRERVTAVTIADRITAHETGHPNTLARKFPTSLNPSSVRSWSRSASAIRLFPPSPGNPLICLRSPRISGLFLPAWTRTDQSHFRSTCWPQQNSGDQLK